MALLLAEEILLLAYRDDTGKPLAQAVELDCALAGAVLAELALKERIDLDGKKVTVTDPTPVGDEELDATLALISNEERTRKPEWWIGKLRSGKLRKRLLSRLTARGVLNEERTKVLGIFPTTRYPERDPSVERAIRQQVEDVLAGAEPSERIAGLIAVLHAAKLARKVFPHASKQRIKQITEGQWAAEAVRKTITSIQAAVSAGVTAAVVTTAASSGG